MRNFKYIWISFLLISFAVAGAVQVRWYRDMDNAKAHYIAQYQAEARRYLARVDGVVDTLYQGLRTLSSLPTLATIDRNAKNMSDEARTTFQLIYNNLADSAAISEVYVLPIDFDPNKIDPATRKTEEPIIAFDQLIVNAGSDNSRVERQTHPVDTADPKYTGPLEIKTFEYKQLVDHAAWLKQHYPTRASFDGLNVPFITGAEVITCDNTQFIKSNADADRSGVIFSVPFYDAQGNIKGMVSAVILTNALRNLLPSPSMALVNSANGYAVLGAGVARLESSLTAVKHAEPDPQLIYSEALSLSTNDARSPWKIWVGESGADFAGSMDVANAEANRRNGLLMLALFAIAAAIWSMLSQRNLQIAEESTAKLQTLNDDISTLNSELAQRFKQLSEAQDAIVKSGRLAQLGQLVATVAHEIRNPLGSVRTTSFALKRKLAAHKIDVAAQMQRIETGVRRCDHIISQLLDFSRTQEPMLEQADLCRWLLSILEEELPHWPPSVTINLQLPHQGLRAHFDTERLRRCVINIVSNACEALTNADKLVADATLTITASKSARGFELIFQDNGPGIPSELLAKIGEPLFTTKNFGTGLGIAATRKVAELHGGGLDISSEQGKGACFVVWFPGQQTELKAA